MEKKESNTGHRVTETRIGSIRVDDINIRRQDLIHVESISAELDFKRCKTVRTYGTTRALGKPVPSKVSINKAERFDGGPRRSVQSML